MINVGLEKDDLVALVKGAGNGSYQLAEYLNSRKLGDLYGFPNEKFHWNDAELRRLTEEELYFLYKAIVGWVDGPPPEAPKLDADYVRYLQESYFKRTGLWLPVDKRMIKQ